MCVGYNGVPSMVFESMTDEGRLFQSDMVLGK